MVATADQLLLALIAFRGAGDVLVAVGWLLVAESLILASVGGH